MSLRFACPECQTICLIKPEHVRSRVKCGRCANIFVPHALETEKKIQSVASDTTKTLESASLDEIDLDWDLDEGHADEGDNSEAEAPTLGIPPASIHDLFRLDIGAGTTPGRVRDNNEDSFSVQQFTFANNSVIHNGALIVVADGMGGYEAGEKASGIAVEVITTQLLPHIDTWHKERDKHPPKFFEEKISQSFQEANRAILQASKTAGGVTMGATAAVALVLDGKVFAGSVGDCRIYRFSGGTLQQISKDQTLVARMVELGQISEAEAENHPSSHEVTQALGKKERLESNTYQSNLRHGEWLIVACDGLHAHLSKTAMEEIFCAAPDSAIMVAHHLIDLTNYLGGSDNTTVVTVRCY